jgi:hypothetical protein
MRIILLFVFCFCLTQFCDVTFIQTAYGQIATSTETSTQAIDPGTVDLGGDMVEALFSRLELAIQKRSWGLVAGIALALLVVLARVFGLERFVPAERASWVKVGLASAIAVSVGLQQGKSWFTILVSGASIGLMAVGVSTLAGNTRDIVRKGRKKKSGTPSLPLPGEKS